MSASSRTTNGLNDRFGGKTVIVGISFGATFAAYAATQRPDLVHALGRKYAIPATFPRHRAFNDEGAADRCRTLQVSSSH